LNYQPKPSVSSPVRSRLKGAGWLLAGLGAFLLVVLIAAIIGGTGSHAKARAALEALKRIQARTEVGVLWPDYSRVLGEQYAEIKPFLESADARAMPRFATKIREALVCYERAGAAWQRKLQSASEDRYGLTDAKHDVEMQMAWRDASAAIRTAEAELGDR
jgi:hypothetical protein